ncbi:DNA-3-methyladenine glycosylase [Limnochorda pilosa]|uniref:Putative 3-methyladenine DNA glycosylase n=1 Tax=Limnochorda pilosa TaxID=1555112 RepID=A0A0K2SPL1_LIMPI|nr:DNA-3-methyladenine glycosylase [Limnochorda pilosa]BAS29036.1 3-methyladenine DNA glycosylase [Limnochorda pilosa]
MPVRDADLWLDEILSLPVLEMARALLGCELAHRTPEGETAGLVVEVEAYQGPEDQAAHSRNGRRTQRVRAMYGPAGHAYVFSVYGMHHCMNVVAGPEGTPHAVLLRALQPLRGLALMARRRGQPPEAVQEVAAWEGRFAPALATVWTGQEPRPPRAVQALTSGPARLARALGVSMDQYGWSLRASPLRLGPPPAPARWEVATGPRVGVEYAGAWSQKPWRFWIRGNPFVSR